VRGYGHVKAKAADRARERAAALRLCLEAGGLKVVQRYEPAA
jgi:hypothetical protein